MLENYKKLISIRIAEAGFNPFGKFEFLDLGAQVFAVEPRDVDQKERIVALHNFSTKEVLCVLPKHILFPLNDIVALCFGKSTVLEINSNIKLAPYQIMWLKGKI